jgi:hypothetical protein
MKILSVIVSIVAFVSVIGVKCLHVKCLYEDMSLFDNFKKMNACLVEGLVVANEFERNVSTINNISTFEEQGTIIEQVYIFNQTMKHFARGFTLFFKNIVALHAGMNKLEYLTREDMSEYKMLKYLYLYHNELQFLTSDVLEDNKDLVYVSFHSNKLSRIGSKLLNPLNELRTAYFNNNICIDAQAVVSEQDVAEIRLEIATRCSDITKEDLMGMLKENERKIQLLSESLSGVINQMSTLVDTLNKMNNTNSSFMS